MQLSSAKPVPAPVVQLPEVLLLRQEPAFECTKPVQIDVPERGETGDQPEEPGGLWGMLWRYHQWCFSKIWCFKKTHNNIFVKIIIIKYLSQKNPTISISQITLA
jgi:hypothetical protein